jgi:hypothetical protein
MSGQATPATLNGKQILARELGVDRATQAEVITTVPAVDRPAGIQLLTAANLAEVRRLTGAAAFPMMNANPMTFLSAR